MSKPAPKPSSESNVVAVAMPHNEVILRAAIQGQSCIKLHGEKAGTVTLTFDASQGYAAALLFMEFTEHDLEVTFRKKNIP